MGATMTSRLRLTTVVVSAAYAALIFVTPLHAQNPNTLLKVSIDIAHEIYVEISTAFTRQQEAKLGQNVARP